jgi:hypothetical protein
MRTVTFKSVLHGVASFLGLDPATNFTSAQAEGLTRYINKHLRRGWEIYPWPELTIREERFFRDAYNAGTTYGLGAEVYGNGGYYASAQAANTNQLLTNTAWWTPLTEFSRYIDLEQTGKTPIGEVAEVWTTQPYLSPSTDRVVPFRIGSDRIELDPIGVLSAWVEYRIRPSEMSATTHSMATAYAAGDRVYLASTGQTYRALSNNTGQLPSGAPNVWSVEPMPYILAPYVTHAAYCDALREDGQHDKARVERAEAESLLDDEMDKINQQQRQTARAYVRA